MAEIPPSKVLKYVAILANPQDPQDTVEVSFAVPEDGYEMGHLGVQTMDYINSGIDPVHTEIVDFRLVGSEDLV